MEKRLKNLGLAGLGAALDKTRSVIAGSFPLQAYLGADWKSSDIDIWCQKPSLEALTVSLLGMGYSMPRRATLADTEEEAAIYKRLYVYIHAMYVFSADKKPDVQVLVTKRSVEDVVGSFDITACQVMYNGRSLAWIDDDAKRSADERVIRISDVATEMQSEYEWLRTFGRIVKYMSRGFAAPDWLDVFNKIHANEKIISFNWYRKWNKWSYKLSEDFPSAVATNPLPTYTMASYRTVVFVQGIKFIAVKKVDPKEGADLLRDEVSLLFDYGDDIYTVALQAGGQRPTECLDVTMASEEKIDELLRDNRTYVTFYFGNNAFCTDALSIQKVLDGTTFSVLYAGGNPWVFTDNMDAVALSFNVDGKTQDWTFGHNEFAIKSMARLQTILKKCPRSNCSTQWADRYGGHIRAFANRTGFTAPVENDKLYDFAVGMFDMVKRNVYGKVATLYSREILYERDNAIFVSCKGSMKDSQFFMLRLASGFLVPITDVMRMLKYVHSGHRKFRISEFMDSDGKQIRLEATRNLGMDRGRGSAVSADHCQDGTGRLVYMLTPMAEE